MLTADTTTFTYDGNYRLSAVVAPEGNATHYTYDSRGNVTEVRSVSKTPGTPADVVLTAGFDATCANGKTCNKPNWTRDAAGNQTDYTYDGSTGNILTVTSPAPVAAASRPQIRYSYTSLQAYFKNASGSIVASGQPIQVLASVSQCRSGSSCAGTVNELKTTLGYGPQTAGTGNNLLPVTVTRASGNGLLSAATALGYDPVGNLTSVDGPLAGTADTTVMIYDVLRRRVGVIGPAPGSGQPNRAQRLSFNADGAVTLAEQGTTTGQTGAAWLAFAPAESVASAYDANGRAVTSTLKSGGQSFALTQYSYDNQGRLDCRVQRMNPAVYAALPASACAFSTQGSDGADRIVKYGYDFASRIASVTNAYNTSSSSIEKTEYTQNGLVAAVIDGANNRTTYQYDGHDRLFRTRYPLATTGANASSATDYEELAYGTNDKVSQVRLRDASTIALAYDNLGRLVSQTPSGEGAITYQYDLLGKPTLIQRSSAGYSLAMDYDGLGRLVSEGQPYAVSSYQYDLAGRISRLTWSGGLYVTYDYDSTGNVTAIRENGATSGLGVLATYSYDALGRRSGVARGNGTSTSYTYDPVSRLASLTQNLAGTANDLTLGSIGYNPAGQIRTLTRGNDAYAWTGHYNVDRPYTNNGLNQVTAAGATALGYDGRGNLTASGTSAYAYDKLNQMVSGPGVSMSYDPVGRLVQYTAAGTTRFGYAGVALVQESDTAGTVLRRYVPGPGMDEPVVWYEGAGMADRRWLHADERGSVIAVSDAAGSAVLINRYDEYGIPQATNTGRFQYTGQVWLPELGQYYYKARMYSPTLGRFMQTDPIGYADGLNWYSYVHADPINGTDPMGAATTCYPTWIPSSTTVGDFPAASILSTRCFNESVGSPETFNRDKSGSGEFQSSGGGSEIVVKAPQRGNTPCPTGGRLTIGGGPSFTGFLGILGLSGGISGNVTIPTGADGRPTLTGAQLSVTGSLTPLVGLGLFGAVGPSGSASSSNAAAPLFSGSITPVFQGGASDGIGAEVVRAINGDPVDWGGSGGRVGAGAYGAVGARFAGTITSPAWGCSR